MNREDWSAFYGWLDTVDLPELRTRHEQLNELIPILRDREVRANALRMRKEIEGLILLYTRD